MTKPGPVAFNEGLRQGGLDLEAKAAAGEVAAVVTGAAKSGPDKPGDGLGVAVAAAAKRAGGKISADAALTIMRATGFVDPEPPEPDFNWSAAHEAVILNEQLSVAIYVNREGDAVIRRQKVAYEDDDAVVVILHENLPKVIAELRAIAAAPKQKPE